MPCHHHHHHHIYDSGLHLQHTQRDAHSHTFAYTPRPHSAYCMSEDARPLGGSGPSTPAPSSTPQCPHPCGYKPTNTDCPGVAYRRDGEGRGRKKEKGKDLQPLTRVWAMENQQMLGLPRTPPPSSTIRRSSSSLRPISLAAITTTYTTTIVKILKRTLPHTSRLLPSRYTAMPQENTSSTAVQARNPFKPLRQSPLSYQHQQHHHRLPHNTTTPPRVSPRFVRARRRPTQKPQSSMIVGP